MINKINNIDFEKGDGLVPVIIQHTWTLKVLMLGYMNKEAWEKTCETLKVTFYSRSKNRLWTKGETSGNYLHVDDCMIDCDKDTILIWANPDGPTCHLGFNSCFDNCVDNSAGNNIRADISLIATLEDKLINRRDNADVNESYTAKLLNGPVVKAAQKVGEEGVEVALAASCQSDDDLLNESADLLYHLIIVLLHRGLEMKDVVEVLIKRYK